MRNKSMPAITSPADYTIAEKYRRDYHEGDIAYRLRSENRSRYLAWYLPLTASTLLLSSLLIPPTNVIGITTLVLAAAIPATIAKLAQNQLYVDVREREDEATAINSGRIEKLRRIAAYLPAQSAEEKIEPVLIDGADYFDRVAANWNTHIGLLSPTGTGKTTTLSYLMASYTSRNPVLFLAVEPKDNRWDNLPQENVLRIGISPTLNQYNKMIMLFDWIISVAELRKLGHPSTFEIVLNLEEYLTTFKQIKVNFANGNKMAAIFLSKIKALQNVGRSLGIHVILISQSPVANDLDMSGGERSNMRLILLGNRLGGFDAIERNITNSQLVASKAQQDAIQAQYDYWKPRLEGNQSLIMANFLGQWDVFPMPSLTETQIKALKIESISANDFDIFEPTNEPIEFDNTGVSDFGEDFSATLQLNFSDQEDLINDLF